MIDADTYTYDISDILSVIFCLIVIAEAILKYVGVEWTFNEWGTLAKMPGTNLIWLKIFRFVVILLLILFNICIWTDRYTKYAITLFVLGVVWCLINIERGSELIYTNGSPFIFVEMSLFIFACRNSNLWAHMRSMVGFLTVLFTCITGYEVLQFVAKYSMVTRIGNSGAIEHFIDALFLFAIWNCVREYNNINNIIAIVINLCLVILSFILTSRGWILQALFVGGGMFLLLSSINKRKKGIIIVLVIIGILVACFILQNYFGDYIQFILDRFSDDTRSFQYEYFLQEQNILSFIFGKGMNATYGDGSVYIDNQFLFIILRYGLICAISYSFIMFSTLLRQFVPNNDDPYARTRDSFMKLTILMWLAAMSGVSIYFNIRMDVANVFVLALILNSDEIAAPGVKYVQNIHGA